MKKSKAPKEPKGKWAQAVVDAEKMVRDARSWLADAEATLAVCQENKKKEDGMDYGTMRNKALEEWAKTETELLAAIKTLHDLHNLIHLICDRELQEHTSLSVKEPFNKIANLRNALKRTGR